MAYLFLQITPTQSDGTVTSSLIFGCVLFTALLLFYIFTPVGIDNAEDKSRLSFLYERKDQVYENLRDLNFEFKAGKLAEADFNSMRDSMEEEAAAILAEIDQLEKASGIQPAAHHG